MARLPTRGDDVDARGLSLNGVPLAANRELDGGGRLRDAAEDRPARIDIQPVFMSRSSSRRSSTFSAFLTTPDPLF